MNMSLIEKLVEEGNIKVELTLDDLVEIIRITAKEVVEIMDAEKKIITDKELIPRQKTMQMLKVKTAKTMTELEIKGLIHPQRVGGRIFYEKADVLNCADKFVRIS